MPVYACPEAGKRCPVFILDKYISKLPQKAIDMDYFYARPLDRVPSDPHEPWYTAVAVGKHTRYKKFNFMCKQAGIKGNKTNHSLRAMGATQMYDLGVPEKLIQERTGHRSLFVPMNNPIQPNTKQYQLFFLNNSIHTSTVAVKEDCRTHAYCNGDCNSTISTCLLYTSPSPRDATLSRMPSSA